MKTLSSVVVMLMTVSLLLGPIGGCTTAQRAKVQQEWQKVEPYVAKAEAALKSIQQDYAFWEAIVKGTLQAAGVKVSDSVYASAQEVIQAADVSLASLGAAVAKQPITAAAVENAIDAATSLFPKLKAEALQNPAVQALYNAWQTGQTNVPVAGQ